MRLNRYIVFFWTFNLVACAAIVGTRTEFTSWRGDKVYSGEGGAVESSDGVEFWKAGEPSKPYTIVGTISQKVVDASVNQIFLSGFNRDQITKLVKANSGDGVILVGSNRSISGFSLPANATSNYGTATADYEKESTLIVFRYVTSK